MTKEKKEEKIKKIVEKDLKKNKKVYERLAKK